MRFLLTVCVAVLAAVALFPLTGCVEGASGGDDFTEAIVFMSEAPALAQRRVDTPWVWLMPADGSVRVPVNDSGLTAAGISMGSLSPDGTNIVYADYGGHGIYRFDLATGESSALNGAESFMMTPAYSPDGGTILFTNYESNPDVYSLYTMAADGANPTVLLTATTEQSYAYTNASYNRAGTKIVLQTRWNYNIAIMDADGTDLLDLTTDNVCRHPSFLPDDRILYARSMGAGTYDLWIMDADGGNKRNLTNTPSVSEFSPTSNAAGTRIAYSAGGSDDGDILVAPFDGTTLGAPVNITANVADPCWRPAFGRVRADLLNSLASSLPN